jgi:hypothetical protein
MTEETTTPADPTTAGKPRSISLAGGAYYLRDWKANRGETRETLAAASNRTKPKFEPLVDDAGFRRGRIWA